MKQYIRSKSHLYRRGTKYNAHQQGLAFFTLTHAFVFQKRPFAHSYKAKLIQLRVLPAYFCSEKMNGKYELQAWS